MCRFLFLLLLFVSQFASATTIELNYVDPEDSGFNDPTPVEPIPGNDGVTRGEQARISLEYVSTLAERVVWVPDTAPLRIFAQQLAFVDGTAATASVISTPNPGLDAFGTLTPVPGIVDGFAYPVPLVAALSGIQSDRTDREGGLNLSSVIDWDHSTDFVQGNIRSSLPILLHEYVHILGFSSGINADGTYITGGMPSIYDRFIINNQINPISAIQMTADQRSSLFSAGNQVRQAGPETVIQSPHILTAGHEAGEVFLSGLIDQQALVHLSDDVMPVSLMRTTAASVMGLGVAAYILSDMGWGDVTDTSISLAGEASSVSLTMRNDTNSANALVTFRASDGVTFDSIAAAPAECTIATGFGELAGQSVASCVFETVDGNFDYAIDIELGGTPGFHTILADVDLQSLHVDPRPLNNFAEVVVQVGDNTITDIALTSSSISENLAAGSEVGMLQAVSSVENVSHSFRLVDGEGGEHNSCFNIVGDSLQSTVEFDFEAKSSFDILVEAQADNGFSFQRTLNVTIDDVDGTQASYRLRPGLGSFSFGTFAYASDGPGGKQAVMVNPFLALWLGVISLLAIGAAAQVVPNQLTRRAMYMATLLLLAGCGGGGGGGGGSSSPPPAAVTPEPEPVTPEPEPVTFECPE